MRIGGIQKCSLIDYPGKLACVIFTQGCNFRCPYCHNRELVLREYFRDPIPVEEVAGFLEKRQGHLNGAVITGGEPTEQKDLLGFMAMVKEMGYHLKLDTNGSHPRMLSNAIQKGLVDYIAMDIKTSLKKYRKAVGVNCQIEAVQESIDLIQYSGIPYEFRTTVVRPLCTRSDIRDIRARLKDQKRHKLQSFKPSGKMINPGILRAAQIGSDELASW